LNGSDRAKDFISFPDVVKNTMGHALYLAQIGRIHSSAMPLKGFGGAGVVELVEDDQRGAYRAVYTVRFESAIYVLHAFQKKSKTGIKTPREEVELVRRRLKVAEEDDKLRSRGTQ
jgi:phage-related protein